jgi:hypothetical protein
MRWKSYIATVDNLDVLIPNLYSVTINVLGGKRTVYPLYQKEQQYHVKMHRIGRTICVTTLNKIKQT